MKECRQFFTENDKAKVKLDDTTVINEFYVTGVLRLSHTRFTARYAASMEGYRTAMMINLWKGSVWGIGDVTGKKYLLKRVNN